MAFEKAKEYLENNNIDNRIIILDKDTSIVSLAAKIKVSELESIILYKDYIDISK